MQAILCQQLFPHQAILRRLDRALYGAHRFRFCINRLGSHRACVHSGVKELLFVALPLTELTETNDFMFETIDSSGHMTYACTYARLALDTDELEPQVLLCHGMGNTYIP